MIAEILNTGKENAITGKSLAMFFQCDLRTIKEQIERERREGVTYLRKYEGNKCRLLFGGNPGRITRLLRQATPRGSGTI